MSTATIVRTGLPVVDPATAVARARARTSVGETVSQTLSMAWRALKKMRRNPEQFFDVTLQPLLFTAMFAYIFGGAIAGHVSNYLPLLIPGIVAQTVLTTCMSTGVQLREDMDKGVFDRFKSMPIARIAPLAGPMVADLVRYLIAAGLTFVMGVIIGYRPGGGVPGVLGAILLAVFTGWAIALDLHLYRHDRPERAQRAGHLDTVPVPADVPVQRVRAGQHAAGPAGGVRQDQPGLAPGVGRPRPGQ
jgi:ABC-2 type transport system permease protein